MRILSICLLLSLLCLGCNRAEEARRKAAIDNLNRIGEALRNYQERQNSSLSEYSHIIAAETAYYTTGPQQARPPEGKFPAGTKINVIKEAGSYTLVRAENGVEAFVAADALKQIDKSETSLP